MTGERRGDRLGRGSNPPAGAVTPSGRRSARPGGRYRVSAGGPQLICFPTASKRGTAMPSRRTVLAGLGSLSAAAGGSVSGGPERAPPAVDPVQRLGTGTRLSFVADPIREYTYVPEEKQVRYEREVNGVTRTERMPFEEWGTRRRRRAEVAVQRVVRRPDRRGGPEVPGVVGCACRRRSPDDRGDDGVSGTGVPRRSPGGVPARRERPPGGRTLTEGGGRVPPTPPTAGRRIRGRRCAAGSMTKS